MRPILDFDTPGRLEIRYNSEWLSGLDLSQILSLLATMTVGQMLAKEGFDPAFGARPLKRALQKYVESPLSVSLLGGQFSEGDKIIVDVDDMTEKLVFRQEGQGIPAEEFGQLEAKS